MAVPVITKSITMFKFVVFFALVAYAYGGIVAFESPLGAPLLPKVQVNPTQVNVVKQPITIQETETVYRHVPVPVKAVAYTAPQVIAPAVYAAPQVIAPAVYAAPQVYSHYVL